MEFKIQTIEKLFYYIVAYSYLLLPICFLLLGNKKKEIIPIIIALYGILCCAFLVYYDQSGIPKEAKKYFYTSYTIFEYVIFAFIFWINFRKDKIRWLILLVSVLFIGFQLYYVFTTKTRGLDSVPIGIETILILIFVLYFFYSFSKSINDSYIYHHYVFWISVGILIYLGGSFFFFILFQQLTLDQKNSFGNITYAAEIIKNILFAISLFAYSRYPFKNQNKNFNSVPYLDMI